MQIDRIKGMEVVRWTVEEYRNLYGESVSDRYRWASELGADPQKGTCCTRGKSDDGLSFVKNFFGIFGHIFRRDYSVANGVLNLSVFPENQVSTTAALSNENSFGMKEVKQAIVSSVFQSITLTLIKIIQRRCFPSFRVRANNQFKNKHRQSSAVRAFIGLRHD